MVLLGVSLAILMQLAGVPALVFAVGVYLPLSTSMPIFVGGMIRLAVDRIKRTPAEESDSSPAVLLSSGYIAGGAIAGILVAALAVLPLNSDYFDASALPSTKADRPRRRLKESKKGPGRRVLQGLGGRQGTGRGRAGHLSRR